MRIYYIYHERRPCVATGETQICSVSAAVGLKEQYSVGPTMRVDLTQVKQRAVHKESEMSILVEWACTKSLKCEKMGLAFSMKHGLCQRMRALDSVLGGAADVEDCSSNWNTMCGG